MLGKIILGIILLTLFFNLVGLAFASSVSISEVMPHPSLGQDWVKITNNTASQIDLTNWTLSDTTSVMKTLSGTIDPSQTEEEDVSNRLNNGGDSITLKDQSGATVDTYSYNSDPGTD